MTIETSINIILFIITIGGGAFAIIRKDQKTQDRLSENERQTKAQWDKIDELDDKDRKQDNKIVAIQTYIKVKEGVDLDLKNGNNNT